MTDTRKNVDDMSPVEKIAYWRDIVTGKIDLSEYDLVAMNESAVGKELTICLRKSDDA